MASGTTWVYREGRTQRVHISVKARTREIFGIQATVVHDKVTARGELVEDALDWYAQDGCGNIWYLGEKTTDTRKEQVVSTAGSWERGVDGAPGGSRYRPTPSRHDLSPGVLRG